MITPTPEQAQQIEEALKFNARMCDVEGTKALDIIRAARAQEQAEQSSVAATPTTLAEPVALLQLAADALVYHTEQTRPIQNTIDVLAAIQKFKEKQR